MTTVQQRTRPSRPAAPAPPRRGGGPHLRLARWSATHPWRAMVLWIVFVAVAVGLAMAVPTEQTEPEDYRVGESGQADATLDDAGLDPPLSESILIQAAGDGPIDRADADAAAVALADGLAGADGVAQVLDPTWNPDGDALLIDVQLAERSDGERPEGDDIAAIGDRVAATAADHPDLRIAQAGDVSTDDGINERIAEDLISAEIISLPVTLVLMLLAFGALIAAGVPVLLGVTSVVATMGLAAPISYLFPAEPTVGSMILLVGMAVGVDYSLFYLKREREERANGRSTIDAVEIAATTSGHAIIVSGLAVIASMAGLFMVGMATFDSLASGAIVVVAVAVLGSLTVLPAILVKLGRWADRPRIPLLWRLNRRVGRGGISSRVLAPVLRFPRTAIGVGLIVIGLLAIPALGMKLHSGTLDTLPDDIPEVATMHRLVDAFPAEGTAAEVVVSGDRSEQDDVRSALVELEQRAVDSGAFEAAGPGAIQVSDDDTTSVLRLVMPFDEADDEVTAALRDLREDLAPAALGDLDVTTEVGGNAASAMDFADQQGSRMPLVIGAVLLLTMVMMAVAFRSMTVALISTVLNLLSVGVAFGLLTLIFQNGWFEGTLDFTSPGFVIDWIPLFVLVVLVGLSMDYHVFVLSRVREEVLKGTPAREAVRRGLTDTAGVVTSAAAVMVSVFAIFATLSMLEMKMMGVGLSAAVLVDATIIRLVLLPAILVLLGDRVWQPRAKRRPRRREPRAGLV